MQMFHSKIKLYFAAAYRDPTRLLSLVLEGMETLGSTLGPNTAGCLPASRSFVLYPLIDYRLRNLLSSARGDHHQSRQTKRGLPQCDDNGACRPYAEKLWLV